ncbi:MAG: lipopolysaccharide transport periplasmic protein LptA [Gammaproteobacteria bacterium]
MTVARFLLFSLLVLPAGAVQALPGDKDQPISVEADKLEIREEDKISIYEGNVHLVQGSLEITSERLVIHFNDADELQLMEMTGAPARFRQLDEQREEMIGEARQINYLESESMLELIEDASFSRAGDIIESDRIRIDTENNSIQAGDAQTDERVKMLIQPRQKPANPD